MSFAQKGCFKVAPTRIAFHDDHHVWIGDDLLRSAFQQFTRTCQPRRHASFAPGPLEARKRASKRRIGALAPLGTIDSLDLSFVPGFGPSSSASEKRSKWQWQEPPQPMTQKQIRKRREGFCSCSNIIDFKLLTSK